MNNIYVDELPKNCRGCHCLSVFDWCNCLKDCVSSEIRNNERPASCPLKLLSDRLAEERKKVVQEFKEKIVDGTSCEILPTGDICITLEKINNVLDQIERGE